MSKIRFTSFCLLLLAASLASALEGDEHPVVATRSKAFQESYAVDVRTLESRGFIDGLQSPEFGAAVPATQDIETLAAEIKKEPPIPAVAVGDPKIDYDVILQPGHYGRKTGKIGTAGARVSERALVAYITAGVAQDLRDQHLSVLVISADQYSPNLSAKVFLSIHAEGSLKQCSTGPSLAYSAPTSTYAMHAIGYALGAAMGYQYDKFRRDNYTANEADYYMFKKIRATTLNGLLEVGELTCPEIEDKLIYGSNAVASNIALALKFIKEAQR